jgi:coronin-1B/1C/6
LPKRGINLHDNEVLRCFKTVKDGYVEPISFIVPRRSEMFQSDIYPPCTGLNPGTTAAEWFGGKTALPPKISLESVYDGGAPEEVPAEAKATPAPAPAPAPVQSPPPTKTEAPKAAPAPAPVAPREPPPSLKDNKQSLASQASKFADKDEDESEDDASSFEEIPKPVQRPTVTAAKQEAKTMGTVISKEPEPPKPTPAPTAAPAKASPPAEATPAPTPAPGAAAGAAAGIKDHLTDIKSTLVQQNKILSDQSDQIALLMREVSQLKTKVGAQSSDREKDERIRQLELELEEARS